MVFQIPYIVVNLTVKYIANGLTRIAEMNGMEENFNYREKIKVSAIGPNTYMSSPKITSQKGIKPTLLAPKKDVRPLEISNQWGMIL